MKSFILISIMILLSESTFAKLPKTNWQIDSGKLSYHVNYPLKKVEGSSQTVRGKGSCAGGKCQFLVAVPVKSFESGDGNRDNHMLEVTKAASFPMTTVKVSFDEPIQGTPLDATLTVTFAGKTHIYEHVKIETLINEMNVVTKGTVPLILSDFDVERPSLLAVKIDDSAPVSFDIKWH